VSHLLELGAHASLGAWLWARHGWSAWAIAALVAILAFGVRLAIVCTSMAISWVYRSPRAASHQLGIGETIAMVLREWRGLVLLNLVGLPWEGVLMRADPEPAPAAHPAVILVHGYFVNRGTFRGLLARLEAAGIAPIFTPNLRSWFAPIERIEADLAAEVERVSRGTGRKVVIVAHSMGGLAARLMLAHREAEHIGRVITIASPHHGTALARLGLGENAAQMRPDSDFLRALAARERESGPGVPFTSIYSAHDNLVAPQETSRLPWARNIVVAGRGHIDILAAGEVLAIVLAELREAGVPGR
jgi:triacylglycerol esterase/lipase EstA (alpha/beta hydrolase family)